jgi:hypothetical protein
VPDGGTERRIRAGLVTVPAQTIGGWVAGTLVVAVVLVLVAALVLADVAGQILDNQRDAKARGCALLALQGADRPQLARLGCR